MNTEEYDRLREIQKLEIDGLSKLVDTRMDGIKNSIDSLASLTTESLKQGDEKFKIFDRRITLLERTKTYLLGSLAALGAVGGIIKLLL